MYESTFHLQRRPFSATPDPSCVYQSDNIQTVIDELVVCLERGEGIAVLTAPAGLGKTLLCEMVRQELGSGFVTVLLRHAHFADAADLLRTILAELGSKSSSDSLQELRLELVDKLGEIRRRGQLVSVICDEAHELTEELLEELRQLVDHADHGVSWGRLLLAGQLGLEEKLAGPELSALNQRLRTHVSLTPLAAQEALDYVDYRITWAGGRMEEVFHPDALTAIIDAADGVPRCLNQLCDHVLLLAYVAEQQPAPPELVHEALADLQHLPLTWNVRAVRQPAARVEPQISESPVDSEPTVEFGHHLATWESSPTFHPADPVEPGEVWEFGSDEEAAASNDPFEHLLREVEHEVNRIEAARAAAMGESAPIQEEPVIDRYAAIDAGWPVEEHPVQSVASMDSFPVAEPVAEPSIEQQIQSDVLELVSSTQDAIASRPAASSEWESPALEAIETPAPTILPDRPFRNLFTRLRRKQKGLE